MLKISISGNAGIKVQELRSKTKTLPQAIAKATVFLERQTKMRYKQEVDPSGKPWAALSPSTLAQKTTNSKLIESAVTINSIASTSAGLIGAVSVSNEIAIYHQTGTSKMPQRKILGINETQDVPKIKQIISDHLGF